MYENIYGMYENIYFGLTTGNSSVTKKATPVFVQLTTIGITRTPYFRASLTANLYSSFYKDNSNVLISVLCTT